MTRHVLQYVASRLRCRVYFYTTCRAVLTQDQWCPACALKHCARLERT